MLSQNDVPSTPNTQYTREEAVRTIPEEINQAKVQIEKQDSTANCVLLPSGSINSRALIAAVLADVDLVRHTAEDEGQSNVEEWFYRLKFQFDHQEDTYNAYLPLSDYKGRKKKIRELADQDSITRPVVAYGNINVLDSNGDTLDDMRGSLHIERLNEVPMAEARRTQLECAEATHRRLTASSDRQTKLRELADTKYAADDNYNPEWLKQTAEQAVEMVADQTRNMAQM